MIFDGFPGGPRAEGALRVVVIWMLPWLHGINLTVWSSSSTCKIHHQTCTNKGIRKNQDAIHENTKIKAVILSRCRTGSSKSLAAWWSLFMVILARMLAVLVVKTCYLACVLHPIWYLGGPSSDSGGLGSTRRETLGFQAWMTESTPRVIGVAVGKG